MGGRERERNRRGVGGEWGGRERREGGRDRGIERGWERGKGER